MNFEQIYNEALNESIYNSRLTEVFGRKRTYDVSIAKGHKYSSKDEEIIFGKIVKPEQSNQVNSHSLLANPGLYFIFGMKDDLIKVIVNEPYSDEIVLYDVFSVRGNTNKYQTTIRRYFEKEWNEDIISPKYQCATAAESEKQTGRSCLFASHIKYNYYRIPLGGDPQYDAMVDDYIDTFKMSPEGIKSMGKSNIWQYPNSYKKVRDVLTSLNGLHCYYGSFLVYNPTFETDEDESKRILDIEEEFKQLEAPKDLDEDDSYEF